MLNRVFFTEQLPKMAFEAWLLREILAYNADRIAGFFRQSLVRHGRGRIRVGVSGSRGPY